MPDANLLWGSDLTISSAGDLALAGGTNLDQQRILRRLLTNPYDYIWHADYGTGLGQFVGVPAADDRISAAILSQLELESSVAPSPPAIVVVSSNCSNVVTADLQYIESATGGSQILSFSLGF